MACLEGIFSGLARHSERGRLVAYRSWPSAEVVAVVLERNNVGWVLTRKPSEHWAVNYQEWLPKLTGKLPQQECASAGTHSHVCRSRNQS